MTEQERIDAGKECPTCHKSDIRREKALGLPLFICNTCNCAWFDAFTSPTMEVFHARNPA